MGNKSTILTAMAPASQIDGEEFYVFPLTSAQRAMWPKGETTRADARYNGSFRMNLVGPANAELLERSLREIALRQESLRTKFQPADANSSEPQQLIFPAPDFTLDVVDLREFPKANREAAFEEISTQEAQQLFDLAQGAPLRFKLLRLTDTHSVLTITIHQIVSDGWSIGILMEELAAIYTAFARQQPNPLQPLAFQFGDYAAYQQEHAASAEVQKQLAFWKQKLSLCPQPQLTPDYPGATDLVTAGIVSELLPRDLTDRLRDLSQQQNTTFYVVTMAGCMALLSRYLGEPDIALRTPLAGRTRVEFEPLIGQFVNQVAIRANASPDATVAVLIDRVREALWEALANQDAPFGEVLKTLSIASHNSEQPFNINFVCQREYGRNGPSTFEFDGVTMTTMPSKSQGALYDLNFFLVEREVGWRLSLEYKAGLYKQETAESLLLHFQEILYQFAEDPQRSIADLQLSPSEALAKRTAGQAAVDEAATPAPPEAVTPGEVLAMPGSLAQERFWTLSQLDPSNPSFHVPVIMKLNGLLSESLLEKSFQILIDRHESLRTTFSEQGGEFLQIIHPAYPVTLDIVAITGTTESERASRVADAIQKEIHRPFDLNVLPLFHTLLCRVSEDEHVLIITLHHILADAASAQIIQRELWTTYEQLQSGKIVTPEPLAVQYGDFSVWQREQIESDAMKAHLDFWVNRLAGDLKVLDFPTDRPPAYRPTSKGAVETMLLPEDLTRSLKQLAQENGTTLYVVTLACFAAMLSRASEAEDLVIGSPVLNRRTETESLIGPFAGPMALRLNLSGNPTLGDLIAATRDRTLEALDHADLPFELLLRKLTLRTQNDRRPLFQFYFMCQTAFVQSREIANLTVTPLPSISMGTPFEMQLAMIERSEGLRAELEYNADLFDQATIRRWLHYYQSLLSVVVENASRRVSDLPAPPFKRTHSQATHSGSREHKLARQTEKPYVAPRDLVEEMVAQVWEGVLGIQSISVHANFFDIGGTSLLILKMVPRINAAFDIVLPVPTIFKAPTIELMANVLRQRNTIEKQVVLPLHPTGNRPPLFMIHSYHLYRALPAALGGDQPFYGVMELELADRHAPYSLTDQVANYVQHIRAIQPKGPYYIAGFCFFGLLAFEVTAQLEALGEKVAFLGLIDTYCPEYWSRQHTPQQPQTPATEPRQRQSRAAPLWHHLRKARQLGLRDKLRSHVEFIGEKLGNQGKSLWLETRVKAYTYFISRKIQLPPWLKDPALVTRVGVRRHTPAKIVSDLYLFPAEDVPLDPDFDPTLGWGGMTTGKVQTMWIPGDHDDMFKEKNIGAMAKTIRTAMDQAKG